MYVRTIVLGSIWLWAATALAQQPPSFTVYFALGSAVPSAEARQVIERAATAALQRRQEGSFDRVKVTGYADTRGSARRSQALSKERADAVKALLISHGLPGESIATEGRGKAALAIATGDNVAELRNRRARIVIYGPGE
jgi:outer membrane protein OmpA-like peptidoglycan-associated protein